MEPLAPLLIVVFPVVFLAIWSAVSLLMSLVGGWRRLSRHYAADREPGGGKKHTMVSGQLGWVNYNGVLMPVLETDALYLQVVVLFRIGHPPLRIPFRHLENVGVMSRFWGRYVRLKVHTPDGDVRLALPEKILAGTPLEKPKGQAFGPD